MQNLLTRCLFFGLLIGWALSHASVFGQPTTKPAGTDKVRQALDKVISAEFNGQSVSDAINHLRVKTGLTIHIDQIAILQSGINPDDNVGQVLVKATDEKAGQVLRKFLANYRLTYIVQDNALLVTTEEMALFRQLGQRVSVDIDGVPFKKAVRDLARSHGINLVIDPALAKQMDTPVSLQVDNTGIETAIRLLAEIASVKAVRMDNVIFVTNADKAKKIRDEEQHQLEIPGNPNMPIPMRAPIARIGGGFGGVVQGFPAPGIAVPELPVPPPNVEPAQPEIEPKPGKKRPPERIAPPAPPANVPAPDPIFPPAPPAPGIPQRPLQRP